MMVCLPSKSEALSSIPATTRLIQYNPGVDADTCHGILGPIPETLAGVRTFQGDSELELR